MSVLEIMDVIICAIILMVHSTAIVIQVSYYIQMELRVQVDAIEEIKINACMPTYPYIL